MPDREAEEEDGCGDEADGDAPLDDARAVGLRRDLRRGALESISNTTTFTRFR